MTYTEMMALPDPGAEHFGETEGSEFSSRISTPTPMNHKSVIMTRSPSQASSTVHTINVNYRHCYSLEKKDGNEIDIPELLESLVQHTQLQSPSKMLQPFSTSQLLATDTEPQSKPKMRTLHLSNSSKPLRFTEFDIPDPPNLKYANELDQLIHDWDSSSHLVIKSVPIPLKHWAQVFRWARPEAWKVLKNEWSQWRVFSFRLYRVISSSPLI